MQKRIKFEHICISPLFSSIFNFLLKPCISGIFEDWEVHDELILHIVKGLYFKYWNIFFLITKMHLLFFSF